MPASYSVLNDLYLREGRRPAVDFQRLKGRKDLRRQKGRGKGDASRAVDSVNI